MPRKNLLSAPIKLKSYNPIRLGIFSPNGRFVLTAEEFGYECPYIYHAKPKGNDLTDFAVAQAESLLQRLDESSTVADNSKEN